MQVRPAPSLSAPLLRRVKTAQSQWQMAGGQRGQGRLSATQEAFIGFVQRREYGIPEAVSVSVRYGVDT